MADLQIIPVARNVEAQYVEMMVPLYSYGCANKVKKSLSNLKGIYSVNVDFHQQKVTVWGICNKYDLLDKVRTKRKEARFWNPEDDKESIVEPKSAPPSPPQSSNSKGYPPRYLTIVKGQVLSWKAKALIKNQYSMGLKALKKQFVRSHSF